MISRNLVNIKMSRCWHVLLLFAGVTHGLKKDSIGNVDTEHPIIFEPPGGVAGDRFGQGVAIDSKSGVAIIGAPKSETHGNIFECTGFKGKNVNPTPRCEKLGG